LGDFHIKDVLTFSCHDNSDLSLSLKVKNNVCVYSVFVNLAI